MSNFCKGLCKWMETKNRSGWKASQFIGQGYKACRTCDIMIKTDTNKCPCCNQRMSLRTTRQPIIILGEIKRY